MQIEKELIQKLKENADTKYRDFSFALTPGFKKQYFIGVRVPIIKSIAKLYKNNVRINEYLNVLPHKYFEENHLHSFLLSTERNYDKLILNINKFLPYINNWAVCDSFNPKVFSLNRDKLIVDIKKWIFSHETYTIRFGLNALLRYYLDDYFKKEYLNYLIRIKNDNYYVKMMIAWFVSTALIKQYETTLSFLKENKLDIWIHNKAIQKAIESFRLNESQKKCLRCLKRH